MDERRDLVDREELRRRLTDRGKGDGPTGFRSGLKIALSALHDMPAAECADVTFAAAVREIVENAEGFDERDEMIAAAVRSLVLAALYPSPGDRDDSEEQR